MVTAQTAVGVTPTFFLFWRRITGFWRSDTSLEPERICAQGAVFTAADCVYLSLYPSKNTTYLTKYRRETSNTIISGHFLEKNAGKTFISR